MLFRAAVITCVLSSFTALAQTQSPSPAGASQPSTTARPATQAARPDEIAALRDDIRKMRLLVQQMENNTTFVSDTQSPLKHQFDLDIQMWKLMIAQMERRVDAMERH